MLYLEVQGSYKQAIPVVKPCAKPLRVELAGMYLAHKCSSVLVITSLDLQALEPYKDSSLYPRPD